MTSVVIVGSCNLDLVVGVEVLPVPGETVLGGDMTALPGGKGANQAVAACRLGIPTSFVGAVGGDEFGASLRDHLEDEGVDLSGLITLGGPTGIALITVDGQAKSLITVAPGANRRLTAGDMKSLRGRLTPSSVLLMQLEIPVATCVAAARIAREASAPVVLNGAPISIGSAAGLDELLALTDVLIMNEGEALNLLAGRHAPPAQDRPALARQLAATGPAGVIVTLGEAGAVVAESGSTFLVPAYPVRAVDTVGAGDAFCGAVAAALAERRPLAEAVRRGCAAGALATASLGAQSSLPTAADLDRLMAAGED
jgi:ribokinase